MITVEANHPSVVRLNGVLTAMAKDLAMDGKKLIADTSRLLAEDFLEITPPFGKSVIAKKSIEKGIKRDLLLTITPVSQHIKSTNNPVLQKRMRQLAKKKDAEALKAIVQNLPYQKGWEVVKFDEKYHTDHRSVNGRFGVKKSMKKMTLDEGEWKAYQKTLLSRVGYQKASWGKIHSLLGGKSPQWISRHFGYAKGEIVNKLSNPNPSITFINTTPGITRHNPLYRKAIGDRAEKMLRDYKFKLNYLKRKHKLAA